MIEARASWKYPPAPRCFHVAAEVFIYRESSSGYDYCGAWAIKGRPNTNKFTIPGSVRDDGLFSDPLEAKAALDKYLAEIGWEKGAA